MVQAIEQARLQRYLPAVATLQALQAGAKRFAQHCGQETAEITEKKS